ncbi:hypothetical protein [Halosimplex amylolyticum]|uniref:hypothetical protein n=1 Tax=Halosimplex amylolyticum TaxID=3396616 RepID=UPI003F56044A
MEDPFEEFTQIVDDTQEVNQAGAVLDSGSLLENTHIAGASLAVMEDRSQVGIPTHARGAWIRSMREAYHRADQSGFSQQVIDLAPEFLDSDMSFENEEFVDIETEVITEYFPQSQLTRDDIVEVVEKAEDHRGNFLDQLQQDARGTQRPFSALSVFDSHQSPGVKEFGAYLGAVNLACVFVPEPVISKGVAVASVLAGGIAQIDW